MRRAAFIAIFLSLAAICAVAQPKPTGKTILLDYNGSVISDREFVDIRMANFHYPDATVSKLLEDGSVEMRTQKIPQEGTPAPAFTFHTIDGKSVSLSDLKGKVVVLNFWFIGCPVCRAMKPQLNEFQAKFKDREDIVFIAATGDPAGDVKKYLQKEPFAYVQAADAAAELKKFVFSGYPKNIVIGKNGEIVYWRSTVKAWDKFESVVKGELAK